MKNYENNVTPRMTRQCRLILDELTDNTNHPTAADIYQAVRRKLPNISLGTVYRNLEKLVKLGRIVRLETGEGKSRYDFELRDHHHVLCIHCGQLQDILSVELNSIMDTVTRNTRYRILNTRIQFRGVCPVCQKSSALKQRHKEKDND